MIMDEMNKNPAERDKKIWESMSHPSKGIYDKIAQYPTMASSKTIGFLSKEGVKWWNQKNRAEWYQITISLIAVFNRLIYLASME